jgi:hypothetical protein
MRVGDLVRIVGRYRADAGVKTVGVVVALRSNGRCDVHWPNGNTTKPMRDVLEIVSEIKSA